MLLFSQSSPHYHHLSSENLEKKEKQQQRKQKMDPQLVYDELYRVLRNSTRVSIMASSLFIALQTEGMLNAENLRQLNLCKRAMDTINTRRLVLNNILDRSRIYDLNEQVTIMRQLLNDTWQLTVHVIQVIDEFLSEQTPQ